MSSVSLADTRREQAIALRRSGRSRREIKEILGVTSNATLDKLLAGEPPPEWTRRPRAKDDLRAKARLLREQGLDYNRIAAELGVSKSSVSLWVRDLPRPERLSYEECCRRLAEGVRRYWEAERPAREAKRGSCPRVAVGRDRHPDPAGALIAKHRLPGAGAPEQALPPAQTTSPSQTATPH
jgi:transposase